MLLVEVSSCLQLDQQQLLSIKLMLPWFTLLVQGIIYSGSKNINLNGIFGIPQQFPLREKIPIFGKLTHLSNMQFYSLHDLTRGP